LPPLSWYERGYRFGQRFRNTLALAVVVWFVGASATFWWHEEVFAFLIAPADGLLSPFGGLPVALAPQDPFGSTLDLAKNGGHRAAFPVLAVGLLSMLKPFVPRRFWLFLVTYSFLAVALFVAGNAFVFFVMMPVSMHFLLSWASTVVVPVITLNAYMELLLALLLWLGIAFELPLIMNLLAKFNVIKYPKARQLRAWAVPTAFIFAALITPSLDGTLTFMVAIPMLLLYEFGLLFGGLEHRDEGNYPKDLADDIKSVVIYIVAALLSMFFALLNALMSVLLIKWLYWKVYFGIRKHGLWR
jgi:sec-independent protein translocase protein TatC